MLSKIQLLLLGLVVSIFLPFIFTGIYLIFLLVYSIYSKDLLVALKKTRNGKFLFFLFIFSSFTSIVHKNLAGLIISCLMLVCFLVIFVYRYNVDKNLFYLTIKIITIMSLFCALVGLVEFSFINSALNSKHIFNIDDRPEFRVSSVFFNANYYATILEFIILLAFYKLFLVKDKESSFTYYFSIIVINSFMLYLTGCRTAWISLFITMPIVFLFQKKYWVGASLIILSIFSFIFLVSFNLIPRFDHIIQDFSVRFNIWKTAFYGFLENPILGGGPLYYIKIYSSLGGPKAPHSHSLYFETLLSFGIVGVSTLLGGIFFYFRDLLSNNHKESYSFAVGAISLVLIHGIFDVTILNLQIGLLFLIIISSTSVDDFN